MADEIPNEQNPAETTAEQPPAEKPVVEIKETGADTATPDTQQAGDDTASATGKENLLSKQSAEDSPDAFTYEAPEGVELDDAAKALINDIGTTAKELGMNQDQFNGMVVKARELGDSLISQQAEAWDKTTDEWLALAKKDPRLGGDDAKFKANVDFASKALKEFGSDGLEALLHNPSESNPHGLGLQNHPDILAFLADIGKKLGSDQTTISNDGQPAKTAKSEGEKWSEDFYAEPDKTSEG